jgi:hypothetical protein
MIGAANVTAGLLDGGYVSSRFRSSASVFRRLGRDTFVTKKLSFND